MVVAAALLRIRASGVSSFTRLERELPRWPVLSCPSAHLHSSALPLSYAGRVRGLSSKFIAPGLEDMLLSISTTTLQGEDVSNTAQLTQYEQEHDASMRRLSKTFQYIRT
jgi:hypothetical protein